MFSTSRDRTLEAPDISSVGLRGYFPERTRFQQAFAKSEDSTSRTSNLSRRRERETISDGHFLHCPTRESLWRIDLSANNPPSSGAPARSPFRRSFFFFFFLFFFLKLSTFASISSEESTLLAWPTWRIDLGTNPSISVAARLRIDLAPKVSTQSQFRSRGCMLLAPGP